MKFAAICHPSDGAALGLWTRGYQFALGQELVRNQNYQELFRLAHRNGSFIIVDNGAAEDEAMSFGSIVWAANKVDADEVILPDVLRDGSTTFRWTTDLKALSLVEPRRRMIVPQGDSWDEWRECLRKIDLELRGEYNSIGLAKHLERLPSGRARAARLLRDQGLDVRHHVHMLGVWMDPWFEISRVKHVLPRVRGIDSGLPVACAQNGKVLYPEVRFSLEWHNTPQLVLAQQNIATLDNICNG